MKKLVPRVKVWTVTLLGMSFSWQASRRR